MLFRSDPKQINLRFEAPAVSEYFIASLLSPVGATPLSQTVSQQEYTRLFDSDHAGIASSTEYFSGGDWVQQGSQYGRFGNMDYSLDVLYRRDTGQRQNNDVEQTQFSARVRQQLTPKDTIYFEVQRNETESGDVSQYYNQKGDISGVPAPSANLRVHEEQAPNMFLGYHRDWNPGVHTLFLAGRLEDDFRSHDPAVRVLFFRHANGTITRVGTVPEDVRLDSDIEAYSAELQQIFSTRQNSLILGGRFQYTEVDTFNSVTNFLQLNSHQKVSSHLDRETLYAYDQFTPWEPLQLTAGVSYDRVNYPRNIDTPPITSGEKTDSQVSPKAGLLWRVTDKTHLRSAYTRSLGGVFFENSYRLEPTQVGGFNQSLRSVAPESSVGLVPATRFETFGVGVDHEFPTRTYLNVDVEVLRSEAERTVGIISNKFFIPVPNATGSAQQNLDFQERSLTIAVNQLLGDHWALGVRYRLSDVDLNGRFPEVPAKVAATSGLTQNEEATLHHLSFQVNYNLPCGFFAQGQARWVSQDNRGYDAAIPGDEFWQFDVFAGYRLWRRHAEVRLGILNLTDQDYKLNPLTLYNEFPRERTFYASFKFYF